MQNLPNLKTFFSKDENISQPTSKMPGITTENQKPEKVPSPKFLAHFVLRTSYENYENMIEFYENFLGGTVIRAGDISFLRYDKEHHRMGITRSKAIVGKSDPESAGLDHVCFTYGSLAELALAYKQRKAKGFLPLWCVNHGPGTSMYYEDPDENNVECQVDNFDSSDDAAKFIEGPEFATNPIGVDFDPENLLRELENGADEKTLKKRADIGARTDLPSCFK